MTPADPVDAFDSDCLIYASTPGHPLGSRVAALPAFHGRSIGLGSVLLVPELLSKPIREGAVEESAQLQYFLTRLDLHPVDIGLAEFASTLGARYRLRAADAIHLATAVEHGADRFITNNRRDFRADQITEVDITYPDDL